MKELEKDADVVSAQFVSELETLADKVCGQIRQMADDLGDIKKSKGYPHSGSRYLADYDFFTVAFVSRFMRKNTLIRTAILESKRKEKEKERGRS